MRSVYYPELSSFDGENLELKGDQLHHIKNVLRLKIGSLVLIQDGKGLHAESELVSISKKSAQLLLTKKVEFSDERKVDLFLGVPKKENLEDICRSAVELGVGTIYLFQVENSPWVYESYSRLKKIMISALLQSNNPYLPCIKLLNDPVDFMKNDYQNQLFLFSLSKKSFCFEDNSKYQKVGMIIGPEGGFSVKEEDQFSNLSLALQLRTPILRATTMVPAGFGFMLSLLKA